MKRTSYYIITIFTLFLFICLFPNNIKANDTLYEAGNNSPEIAELKTKLNKLGFTVGMNYPNNYGPETKEAVMEFQNYYGLKSNNDGDIGTVDTETLDKLDNLLDTALMRGDRKGKVTELKQNLNFLNFPVSMNTPNSYGPKTELAVKDFQKTNGLKITGIVEEKMLNKIEELKSLPMKKGMKRGDVVDLKNKLNKLGFTVSMNYPNSFGAATEKSVKEFQKSYGFSQNGVADSKILSKLDSLINLALMRGDRKDEVTELKQNLNFLNFPVSMNTPNSYGPKTELAVKDFQKSNGLKVTGIVEEKMLNKIEELKSLPMKKGMKRGDVIELKENLNTLGITVSMDYPNSYGSATEKAVKTFQGYYGLSKDGVAGPKTVNKIDHLLKNALKKGHDNSQVKKFKNNLEELGFLKSNETNNFGPSTVKAVKEFQKYYGLVVSGIGEESTLDKIENILINALKRNDNNDKVKKLKDDLITLGFKLTNDTPNFGPQTVRAVKDFQKSYNLSVSGIAEEVTINKIDHILKNALKRNDNNSKVKTIKNNLVKLGFLDGEKDNKTNNFGAKTVEAVKSFQEAHDLPVSGMVEELTLAKIEQLIEKLKDGNFEEYSDYGITLNEALDIQMSQKTVITDKYGNDPAYISANYFYDLGTINSKTVNIRVDKNSKNDEIAYKKKKGQFIAISGSTNGRKVSGSTKWYKVKDGSNTYFVHSSLVKVDSSMGIASSTVNVRAGKGTNFHIFNTINKGTRYKFVEKGSSWHQIEFDTWRRPTRTDMIAYLDPNKNDKTQHLRLDSSIGVSSSEINKILSGKGILKGKGQSFINATKNYGVNEAYLIAHAFLESGHGTSTLAKGVKYNGKTVYNMFGIGAVDSDPLNGGAKTAYENGWFSPEEAIEGGAKWIRGQYIHNQDKQNTLYKMKWNPNMNNGRAWKQYATDIGWAVKQTSMIKNLYKQVDNPSYHYDIAQYK